jgi:hypothetical protein
LKYRRHGRHTIVGAVGIFFSLAVSVYAQVEEEELQERAKKHFPAVFIGATTSENKTGPSLGLEYEYRFTERWGLGGIFEFTLENDDREFLGLVPVRFHYMNLSGIAALGFEVSRPRPTANATEEERTTSAVGRLGLEYGFEVGREIELAPNVNVDISEEATKLVWGLVISKGF